MKTSTLLLIAVALAPTMFSQSSGDSVEVPFAFTQQQIILKVEVNHKGPFNMLLDTGCGVPFVTRSLARGLGLAVSTKGVRVWGPANPNVKAFSTTVQSIEIGALEARNIEVFVTNEDDDMQVVQDVPIDGLLGYSFLKNWVVQIDYPSRVVRFGSKAPLSLPGDQHFRLREMSLIDDVRVNGRRFTGAIDTGLDFPFYIHAKTVKSLGITTEPNDVLVSLKSVNVGDIKIESPLAMLGRKGDGWDSFPANLTIGNHFLRDYEVTIDYPRNTIILRRSTAGETAKSE